MENDIWNEISSFLNQLRCENINRESYIYFQELANIQLKKKMEKEKVNKLADKYIAILYIGSNTGRNVILKFANQAGM